MLFRFAIVGVGVAALYVAAYLLMLEFGLGKTLANLIAFATAITVQYIGQAAFTFRKPLDDQTQMLRFICMIGAGFLSAGAITGFIGPALSFSDIASAISVTLILPVQNFFIMKLWVFTQNPKADEVPS